MVPMITVEGHLQSRVEVVALGAPEVQEMEDVAGIHQGMALVAADPAVRLTLEDLIRQMRTTMHEEETTHGQLRIRGLQYHRRGCDIP